MKKIKNLLITLSVISAVLIPLLTKADVFKSVTLFKQAERIAVYSKDQANKLFSLGYKLETTSPVKLGISIPTAVANFETSLAASINSTATSSMTLVSGTTDDGTTLNGIYGFVIDSGASNQEYILATCSNTACSGLTRGISVTTGNTSVTALKSSHRRGASVKITDHPVLITLARILNGQETIPNVLIYDSSVATSTFTNPKHLVTKEYADSLTSPSSYWTLTGADIYRASGNVGIGLTNPTKNLDVTGTGRITTSLVTPIIYPASDGVAAVKINKANGTSNVLSVDTTNSRVGIGLTNPSKTLDVTGTVGVSSTLNVTGLATFGSIPIIPTSTPTTAGQVIGLDSAAKLPAVDGSQLTGINVFASGTFTSTSTATTTITTGFTPTRVNVYAISGPYTAPSTSFGGYDSGGNKCTFVRTDGIGVSSTYAWNVNDSNNANYNRGTIANITSTGFNLISNVDTSQAVLYWTAEK